MVSTVMSKTMELEGNLKAFQLSDILRFLAMGKMSGVLTFSNRENMISLTIKDGAITGTCSADRFPKLGQMLIYKGLITRKSLEDVLDSQRDTEGDMMIGEILIERGLVTHEQIESALTLQIREELWDLFSWADGTFKFEHGLNPALQRPLVTLEIEPLIEEGFEHMEQWRVISSNLSDLTLVFRVSPELAAQPEARLHPNTWRVLSLINGRHSLEAMIFLSGLGRFETLCALDRLLTLQLIEPVTERPRATALEDSPNCAPATQPPDTQNTTQPDEEPAEGRRRNLFGMRRRAQKPQPAAAQAVEEKKTPAAKAGPFLTDVGLACATINAMVGRFCAEPDFRIDTPARLIAALWGEIGVRFPRADLISAAGGRLDPKEYERFVSLAGGINDSLAGCHEDSMEMLAQMGLRLARLARERLGDRAARVAAEAIQPCLDCTEVQYPADFLPRLWAEHWTDVLK